MLVVAVAEAAEFLGGVEAVGGMEVVLEPGDFEGGRGRVGDAMYAFEKGDPIDYLHKLKLYADTHAGSCSFYPASHHDFAYNIGWISNRKTMLSS